MRIKVFAGDRIEEGARLVELRANGLFHPTSDESRAPKFSRVQCDGSVMFPEVLAGNSVEIVVPEQVLDIGDTGKFRLPIHVQKMDRFPSGDPDAWDKPDPERRKWVVKITDVTHSGLVVGEAYTDCEKGTKGYAATDWRYDSAGCNAALMPSMGTFASIGAPVALWYLIDEVAKLALKLEHHRVALAVGQGTWGPMRIDMDLLKPRLEQMLYEAGHGYAPRDSDLGIAMARVTALVGPKDHGRGPGGA